ncbi:response regulator [Noviherbaspirillum pedocola]|uniref:Response regulator n=1 Tax=Noviherbaspirillum pedocola TaxID=2801341 RepID=A0A934W233_9BURK|nr:response regulator [Noviherbaspirillum pedocola]MBK4735866.1 response regulator [Noviherbaspirillum pedocola]
MKHILVVDDEVAITYVFRRYFEHCGYRVSTADNGDSAWSSFQRDPADAVLTDQTMPGLSGVELTKHIHAKDATIPVILFSAYVRDIVNPGGNTVMLEKPASMTIILGLIKERLNRASAAQSSGHGDARDCACCFTEGKPRQ